MPEPPVEIVPMRARQEAAGESRGLTGDRLRVEPVTYTQVSTGAGTQLPELTARASEQLSA